MLDLHFVRRLVVWVMVGWACAGCAATAPYVWFSEVPVGQGRRLSVVEPGDKVSVVVLERPELSGEHVVGVDGTYVQPLAGPTSIGGKTLAESARQIAERLAPYLKSPAVSVTLVQPHLIRVNMIGEIRTPGNFEVHHDEGILALLARGGGFTEFADRDSIYIVRKGGPVPRIRFRYQDLERPHPRAAEFSLRDGDTLVVE